VSAILQTSGNPHDRSALVLSHQPLARMLAAQAYGNRQVRSLEFDDFHQFAILGLIEAAERFEPSRGSFENFARAHIKGAVLDGVSNLCEQQAQISWRAELRKEYAQNKASQKENAKTLRELANIAVGLAVSFMLEDTGQVLEAKEPGRVDELYSLVDIKLMMEKVKALCKELPTKQRNVIVRHYLQKQSITEISIDLEISKGRICQIHDDAVINLQHMLNQKNKGNL
jgi:RNA polymerase sigma factor FliA